MQLAPGTIVAGKYRVERTLGAGGMGYVVAATHLHLEEPVAIKFLLPEVAQHAEAKARFTREAKAAAKIKSEHVTRVLDVAELEDGTLYLVMEFLSGNDLGARLQKFGVLEPGEAIEYLLQACEALAEAHSLGIVHRDLKPANLFLAQRPDGSPCVKVLDFGISKISSSGGSGPGLDMTKTSAIMGSPNYMSPEQLMSARDVDARADIWSLGITLYELLTNRLPFEAEALPQLCTMILHGEATPIRTFRPDLPQELQNVLTRCLARDRAYRYQSVAELAVALGPLAPRRSRSSIDLISRVLGAALPPSSADTVMAASPPTGGAVTHTGFGGTSPAPQGSKAGLFVVVALLIFFVAGGGGAAWWFTMRQSAAAASSEAPSAAVPGASQTEVASPPAPPAVAPAAVESAPPAAPTSSVSSAPSSSAAPPPATRVVAARPHHAAARATAPTPKAEAPAQPQAVAPPAPAPAPLPKPKTFHLPGDVD